MTPFAMNMTWLKTTAFAGLTALSLSDVVVARACPPPTVMPAIVRERAEKPRTLDPINAVIDFCQKRYGLILGRDEALKISESIRLVYGLLDDEARRIDAATASPRQDSEGGPCAAS